MIIQHNISALNANRQLNIVRKTGSKSAEKLSSGYRINRAADDAAGLSISEKMRKQIRGLTQAGENVEDGISLCQVADGAMAEMHDMTNRMNELCVQAANGTNSSADRSYIQMEIDNIVEEFGRIINTTKFNEVYIFKGDEDFQASAGSAVKDKDKDKVPDISKVEGITAYEGNNFGEMFTDNLNDPGWVVATTFRGSYPFPSGSTFPTDDRNCAWIDFTDLAAGSREELVSKLNGEGFDWSCCYCPLHGCIKFVSGATGTGIAETSPSLNISYEYLQLPPSAGRSSDEIVKIDINSVWNKYQSSGMGKSLGEFICETLVDVLSHAGNSAILGHSGSRLTEDLVAFTYKTGTGKFYLIDKRGGANYPGSSEFSVTPRNDAGEIGKPDPGEAEKPDDLVHSKFRRINTKQLAIHAGADTNLNNKVVMYLPTMTKESLRLDKVSVLTEDIARDSIDVLNDTLRFISEDRSRIGAYQNRLEHTALNLDNIVENTTNSESKIRDTDMADEMVKYSNNSVLAQAGQSMLSQANNSRQNILSLLTA